MNKILDSILSLINIIRINLLVLLKKSSKKKIIFFYHSKSKLTFIHKFYIEDIFENFSPEDYIIIYGHQIINLKQQNYFFIKERYLRFLFNINFFLSNNVCDIFTLNSKKIYIHHNLYDDPWVSNKNERKLCERLNRYDYILMSAEFSLKRIDQTFKKYNIKKKVCFLEVGYVKLDYLIKNKSKTNRDSILIAPTGIKGFPELSMKNLLIPMIQKLLKLTKYRIILRPHPSDMDNIFYLEIKEKFKNNNRFNYDTSNNYINVYLRSKIMITDLSGTAYTFAFLNLSPVIFCSISEGKLKKLGYLKYDFFKERSLIGEILQDLSQLDILVNKVLNNYKNYEDNIKILRNKIKYLGKSQLELKKFFKKI